jgi:hypothetical protein
MGGGGEFHSGIQGVQLGIVPGRDLAQEDVRDGFLRKLDSAGDARDLVGEDHGAHGHGDVVDRGRGLGTLLGGHLGVGGAEVDRLLQDLLDATPGTDGLVVDLDLGFDLLVFGHPLGVEGIGKGSARSLEGDRLGGSHRGGRAGQHRKQCVL